MQELLRNADLVRPRNFFDPILARPLGHVADAAQLGARERPPWDPGRAALLPHVHRWLLTAMCSSRSSSWSGRCSQREEGVVDAPEMYVRRLPPTTARFLISALARRTTTWRNPPGWRSSRCSGRRFGRWRGVDLGVSRGGRRIGPRGAGGPAPARRQQGLRPSLSVLRPLLDGGARLPGLAGGLPEVLAGEVARTRAASSGERRLPLGSFGGGCGTARGLNGTTLWVPSQNGCVAGTAAPTDRAHAAPDRDLVSALVDEANRPSHEQRTVRRDADDAHRDPRVEPRPRSDMPRSASRVPRPSGPDAVPGCRAHGQPPRARIASPHAARPVGAVRETGLRMVDVGQRPSISLTIEIPARSNISDPASATWPPAEGSPVGPRSTSSATSVRLDRMSLRRARSCSSNFSVRF